MSLPPLVAPTVNQYCETPEPLLQENVMVEDVSVEPGVGSLRTAFVKVAWLMVIVLVYSLSFSLVSEIARVLSALIRIVCRPALSFPIE